MENFDIKARFAEDVFTDTKGKHFVPLGVGVVKFTLSLTEEMEREPGTAGGIFFTAVKLAF